MYQILEPSTEQVVGTRISQELTKQDYETLIPTWEKAIQKHGTVRMLWQMDDFQGWSPEAAIADLKFDFQHHYQVERLAVVGQNWWDVWMTKVTDLVFPHSEARYFPPDQLQSAWEWVKA